MATKAIGTKKGTAGSALKRSTATSSKAPYAVKQVAGKRMAVVKTLGGKLQVNLSPTPAEARASLIALGVISPNGKRTRKYAVTAKK